MVSNIPGVHSVTTKEYREISQVRNDGLAKEKWSWKSQEAIWQHGQNQNVICPSLICSTDMAAGTNEHYLQLRIACAGNICKSEMLDFFPVETSVSKC